MIISKLMKRVRGGPSCREVMRVIQSHLDGEVDVETAREIAAHLDHCDRCEGEAEIFRQIKRSLAHAAEPVDPEILASLHAFSERLIAGELD